jgi:hypothetical protein
MPHAKTDSEVTSLAPSSPPRSPPHTHLVYYVQSPSRDSHDSERDGHLRPLHTVAQPHGLAAPLKVLSRI